MVTPFPGFNPYLEHPVLNGKTHLIEIDLLTEGKPMLFYSVDALQVCG